MMPHRARSLVVLGCLVGLGASAGARGAGADTSPLRRRLARAMGGADEIVFAVRVAGRDHWYANFGTYADRPSRRAYGDGGRLCRLSLSTGKLTVLLDDPTGGVRDPHVHYDGKKILFSYRPGGTGTYHLYEINTDGSALRQLTDGNDDDIEPVYLPCGEILFCSSRCRRFVPCWYTRVAILARCDADGRNVRLISSNVEHENTPWLLPDGRVLFMRWEYVDRNQLLFHHLWTVNPDGSAVMVYYGNQFPGWAMLDAKPIPGTNKVVASFSPGHGRAEHMGEITIVDPGTGPDNAGAARRVSRPRQHFRDPYALAEDCFLVAGTEGILVMDARGETEVLYRLEGKDRRLSCHEPRPLRARRREPVIAPRSDPSRPTGRLVLANVYEGRNMAGVRRGTIKKLLVLEQLPKPGNFSGGQEPLSIGGTFCLERILGTVPVAPDGSAYMEVPALRSLLFVALDANDLSVKRMQSFVTVQPGEVTGCVGCHEPRSRVAPRDAHELAAVRKEPARIEPIAGVGDVLDFPRDVQPILDAHCLRCHNPDRRDGGVDLCGDHTPAFSVSYWTLVKRGLISDGRNTRRSNLPPRAVGSCASRGLRLLDGSHYAARPSKRQRAIVRLWIESGAPYPGTYAALGSGMAPVQFPAAAIERRCGACHGSMPTRRHPTEKGMFFQFGRPGPAQALLGRIDMSHITLIRRMAYYQFGEAGPHQSLCNLSRPAKSLLLQAPLAKDAGGLGLCSPRVFADTTDADYQAILRAVAAAAGRLDRARRFDMTGFRPTEHYVREMTRFGILRAGTDPADIDPYATDRAYWRSFWYVPARDGAAGAAAK